MTITTGNEPKGLSGGPRPMKLTTKARKAIPTKSFAGPDRSYPIEDASHARNALSRVSQHGSPALKAKVRAAVHRKYPGIGAHAHHPPAHR